MSNECKNEQNQTTKVTEDLADRIVVLVRTEEFEGADHADAALLAQHRLFGSIYMNALFIGRLYPHLLG